MGFFLIRICFDLGVIENMHKLYMIVLWDFVLLRFDFRGISRNVVKPEAQIGKLN